MIIRSIEVLNFGPFLGSHRVELPEGIVVVVAEYEDAAERSNRAGKSFLAVDATTYALFGAFRGSTDEVVHRAVRGEEDAWVEEVVESSDGRVWTIRRGRSASGRPIRTVDGDAVSEADLTRIVAEDVLGLTEREYRMTCASVQGRISEFMELTPEAKRRVVAPWFGVDRWVPRAELANDRLKRTRRELDRVHDRMDALREEASALDARSDALGKAEAEERAVGVKYEAARQVHEASKAAGEARDELLEVAKQVRLLSKEVSEDRKSAEAELDDADAEVKSVEGRLARARDVAREVEELRLDLANADDVRRTKDAATKAEVEAKAQLGFERARLEGLRDKFKRLGDLAGVCPVLGEPCDRIDASGEYRRGLVRDGRAAKKDEATAVAACDEATWRRECAEADLHVVEDSERAFRKALASSRDVTEVEDELAAAKIRASRAKSALRELRTGRDKATRALKRAQTRQESLEKKVEGLGGDKDIDALHRELYLVTAQHRRAIDDVADAKAAVNRARDAEEEAKGLEARALELSARVERLAWCAYAFGVHGIPSRELENAFGEAESAMNVVLEDLGVPTRVRFSPTRDLKSWEPACLACGEPFEKGERTHVCRVCTTPRRRRRKDELRLDLIDGEHESRFDLDSGGGKTLISIGTRLGLARLPARTRRVACQHLLIDEPDGALDGPNRRALYAMLRRRLGALGIRQAILVTHADVREDFPQRILVRRIADEDRSTVRADG